MLLPTDNGVGVGVHSSVCHTNQNYCRPDVFVCCARSVVNAQLFCLLKSNSSLVSSSTSSLSSSCNFQQNQNKNQRIVTTTTQQKKEEEEQKEKLTPGSFLCLEKSVELGAISFLVVDEEKLKNVTLSIRRDGDPCPVYMKQDGQRFKLPRTLKLFVDTSYRVDLSFKPPQVLLNVQVQNMEVQCSEKSRDRTASAYSAQYPTHGVPASKNGVRHDIPVVMQLSEGGDLVVSLQVKFYKTQESNHSDWGSSLHCIEYECTLMPGIDRVIVTKETYRLTNSKPRLC